MLTSSILVKNLKSSGHWKFIFAGYVSLLLSISMAFKILKKNLKLTEINAYNVKWESFIFISSCNKVKYLDTFSPLNTHHCTKCHCIICE